MGQRYSCGDGRIRPSSERSEPRNNTAGSETSPNQSSMIGDNGEALYDFTTHTKTFSSRPEPSASERSGGTCFRSRHAVSCLVLSISPAHSLHKLQSRNPTAQRRDLSIACQALSPQRKSNLPRQASRFGEHQQRTHPQLYGHHGHALPHQAAS